MENPIPISRLIYSKHKHELPLCSPLRPTCAKRGEQVDLESGSPFRPPPCPPGILPGKGGAWLSRGRRPLGCSVLIRRTTPSFLPTTGPVSQFSLPPKSHSYCLAGASILLSCTEQVQVCKCPAAGSEPGGDASFTPASEEVVDWAVKDELSSCWRSALV